MKATPTPLSGVLLLEPKVFGDTRGFFFESYNKKVLESLGISTEFVQDNHSGSERGVLRGLHYQIRQPQAKLIRVVEGEIFDVVVDIRKSSPTFGKWYGVTMNASNKLQLFVPTGFAHGFLALSDWAQVLYKATDFYAPEHERCIIWNDPSIDILWPLSIEPNLSPKDKTGVLLSEAELFK